MPRQQNKVFLPSAFERTAKTSYPPVNMQTLREGGIPQNQKYFFSSAGALPHVTIEGPLYVEKRKDHSSQFWGSLDTQWRRLASNILLICIQVLKGLGDGRTGLFLFAIISIILNFHFAYDIWQQAWVIGDLPGTEKGALWLDVTPL